MYPVQLLRFLITLLLWFGEISGQRCPLYWQQNGNVCYRFRYINQKSWSDAESWCQAQNADLVKFENVQERDWMINRIKRVQQVTNSTNVEFWTGLNNNGASAGTFTWADGSVADSAILNALNTAKLNGHCGKISNNGYRLTNVDCGELHGYICERNIGIALTCNADAGWQSFNGFCYKVYSRSGDTWAGAQRQCDLQGGNLFNVESPSEEDVIHDFSKNTMKDYWIGVKSFPQNNSYAWLTLPVNATLSPSLSYWSQPPQLQSSQYNNTCAYVAYTSQTSNIAWTTDRCDVKKNFVCKRQQGNCQPGWLAHQDTCYQFNTQYLLSWQKASQFCKDQGGQLVEIDGKTGTNFLNSYLDDLREARIPSFWIGATDNNNNTANYTWSWGTPVQDYQNWFQNPPVNTPNSQDCVYINTDDILGKWRTTPNCGTNRAFICTIGFDQQVQIVTTPQPKFQCDDHWTLNNRTCFQFNDTRKDYLTARESCQSQGGDLATVSSDDDHSFVINRIQNEAYWIGLNDRAQNGNYVWVYDGSKVTYTKWCPNEPNDFGQDENCVQYANKCWNDMACSSGMKYICSKPPQNIPLGPPITTTPLPISMHCGLGWEERPQSSYCYGFYDDQLSWYDARQVCQKFGGDLASIHDREEQSYIQTRLNSMMSFWLWLGGTDRNREGGWSWSDGTPFNLLNWAAGEPNGQTRENCIQIYSHLQNQQWNDGTCNSRSGFICKKFYGQTTALTPRPTPQVPAGQFLGCPDFWKSHGDSCWHFVTKTMSATDARSDCQRTGGYLATINSQDEQNFISANIPKPFRAGPGIINGGGVWIGISDRLVENYFQWDDGTPVMYTNWATNEPNNFQNQDEDCVGVWLQDGGWNDLNCNVPLQGYVCRKGLQVVASTGDSPLLQGCTQPYRGYGYGASCYALQDSMKLSWQDAQTACKTKAGQLATVNDRYVQSFLSSYVDTRTDYFWIGLSQSNTGTYNWVQGQTDLFTFWHSTHTGNENGTCVAMRTTHPIGLWENKPCTETHNYICETQRTGFTNPPTTQPPVLPCPTGWTSFSSFCYQPYSSGMTWLQARDFCRNLGGDLVSIHSQPETDFLVNTLNLRSAYWIGFNDWDIEGSWVWSDQSGVTYTAWNPTEPNNYNNDEDCAFMGSGKWVDINCFTRLKPLCKRPQGLPLLTTQPPPFGFTSIVCGVESMWLFYNGACFMVSPPDGRSQQLSWYDARTYCNSFGADLASIHTTDENRFLYSQAKLLFMEEYWIGLNEVQTPGRLSWIDNSNVDFINWDQNEPNDQYGREKCTAMNAANGNWNDENCNLKLGFFCKKKVGQSGPITQPTTVIPQGGCVNNLFVSSPFSNKCFSAINSTMMTWNQSVIYCQNTFGVGYDVASISNRLEQAFLTSLVQGFTANVWIGLNDLKLNRQFVWNDNSPLLFNNWNSGEPNGRYQTVDGKGFVATEQCVEMVTQGGGSGFWNDQNCNELRYTICQGQKIPGQTTPSAKGSCPKQGYVQRGTSCYKFVTSSVYTWQVAENLCQGDGGVLASINDVFENEYILSQMGLNVDYWIGLQYNPISTSFSWQQSWPVTFTSWAYGEPNHAPNNICVKSQNGTWSVTFCSRAMGYVCEINSAQVPSVTVAPIGHCQSFDDAVYGDYCYHFSPFTYVDWPNARYYCAKLKMDLVSITSDIEQQFVFSAMTNSRDSSGRITASNFWIGLNKGFSSGFQWTDNSGFSYNNWNTGEPSDPMNSTSEECVEMYRDTGAWNDVNCFQKRSFVCKGRAIGGPGPTPTYPTFGPPKTSTNQQGPVTFPTLPNVFPLTTPPSTPGQSATTNPNGGQTLPTNPIIVIPTNPPNTPRITPKPGTAVTYVPPTGYINGPNQQSQNTVIDNKHGLTGGALAAVLAIIVTVIGVIGLIGLMWWKKRNPNRSGGFASFDNAMYNKGNEQVEIDSSKQVETDT